MDIAGSIPDFDVDWAGQICTELGGKEGSTMELLDTLSSPQYNPARFPKGPLMIGSIVHVSLWTKNGRKV